MAFAESAIIPYVPLGLLAILIFYLWAERRYWNISLRFAQGEALGKITPQFNKRRRRLKIILNITAIFFIALALMRPQWGIYWKKKRTQGVDILFALDTSRSMLARDVKPDRFSFAKGDIETFVRRLKGNRVGLIIFSGDAFLQCPLTMDYDGFFLVLNSIETDSVARGGTSIPQALEESLRSFEWSQSEEKILIILSDGENTEGDVDKALGKAKEQGVQISCIGIGSEDGEIIRYVDEKGKEVFLKDKDGNLVRSKLDEGTLKNIAKETGGVYIRASTERSATEEIYKKRLEKLTMKKTEEMLEKSYKERFQIPTAIALLCLLVEMIIIMVNRDEKD